MPRRVLAAAVLLLVCALPCAGQEEPPPELAAEPLYFGVVSFYYPRLMFIKYQPLVDYLSEHTGRRWELRLSATYQQTAADLCAGRLTAAYLGPLTYVRAHEACGVEPVVRLHTGGRDTYRSYVMVRTDSPVRELADLAGAKFAFGSVLSTSSHLVPRAMLAEAGLRPGQNVRCSYLDHHEEAARAVLLGEADACGVRDLVGDRFLERGLRLLAASEPIPNFPVAIAPGTPDAVRRQLVHVLVDLPREDSAIAAIMATWDREMASGFVPAGDAEYDVVRDLAEAILGSDVLTLPEENLRCAGSKP